MSPNTPVTIIAVEQRITMETRLAIFYENPLRCKDFLTVSMHKGRTLLASDAPASVSASGWEDLATKITIQVPPLWVTKVVETIMQGRWTTLVNTLLRRIGGGKTKQSRVLSNPCTGGVFWCQWVRHQGHKNWQLVVQAGSKHVHLRTALTPENLCNHSLAQHPLHLDGGTPAQSIYCGWSELHCGVKVVAKIPKPFMTQTLCDPIPWIWYHPLVEVCNYRSISANIMLLN